MSQQGQPSGVSDDMLIFGIIAICVALMALTAYVGANQAYINAVAGAISWVHVAPIAFLGDLVMKIPGAPSLPFLPDVVAVERFLRQNPFSGMSPEQRDLVLGVAGRCASIVYAPMLVILGMFGTKFRPDQIYREKPTLSSMIDMQSKHWKTLQPIRAINPAKMTDVNSPAIARAIGERRQQLGTLPSEVLVPEATAYKPQAWARAMRPEEWLVAQGATHDQVAWQELRDTVHAGDDQAMIFNERWLELTTETAIELLSGQLTQEWIGFDGLRPYQKCLCAVFAQFFDYNNSKGEALLNELAILYAAKGSVSMDDAILAEKALFGGVEAALKSKAGKNLADQANQHAWLQTAMVRMLTVARKDRGVLAAAQFNWVKAEDRSLWYALCNTGGDAFMIETAGVFAHFKAEVQLNMPLRRPAVYQAARSLLEDYLDLRPERVEKRAKRAELSKPVSVRFKEALKASVDATDEEARKKVLAEAMSGSATNKEDIE